MNWESVKYIDPYLGLVWKFSPYGELNKQLVQEECIHWGKLPPDIKTTSHLQDPRYPVIMVCGGVTPLNVSEGGKGGSGERRSREVTVKVTAPGTTSDKGDKNAGKNILIFNPEKNSWKYFGVMPEPRNYHQAVFTRGYVFITGGNDPSKPVCEQASNATLRLNIRSKRWKKMANMKFHRSFHCMVAIDDAIFVFGGRDERGGVLACAEKYNPEADQWTMVKQMPEPRMGMGCTAYNGQVWLIGGFTYPPEEKGGKSLPILNTVLSYDPVKNMYVRKPSLPEPRAFIGASTIAREVWVFGGLTLPWKDAIDLVSVPWVDVYNTETQEWERRHEFHTPKHAFATVKSEHRVFLFGGMNSAEQQGLKETEMYDKSRDRILELANLPIALVGAAGVGLPVDLVGKETGGPTISSVVTQREPEVKEEQEEEETVTEQEKEESATVIQSWFRGHNTRNGNGDKLPEKFIETLKRRRVRKIKLDKKGWRNMDQVRIPSWPVPKIYQSSSFTIPHLTADDAAGEDQRLKWRRHHVKFLPENDPNLGTVLPLDNFYHRHKHILGLREVDAPPDFVRNLKFIQEIQDETLPMVVTIGGLDPKSEAENKNLGRIVMRYHPLKDRWEYYGLMPEPRCHHGVAYMGGFIYVTGGYNPDLRDSGEMIATRTAFAMDVRTGKWRKIPDMNAYRAHHGVAVLKDQLFCIGGRDHRGRLNASVEVFDPMSGTWNMVDDLEEGKMGMAVTVSEDAIWMLGGATNRSDEDPHFHYMISNVQVFNAKFGTGVGKVIVNTEKGPEEAKNDLTEFARAATTGLGSKWANFPPLRVPRAYASAVTLNYSEIWIVGGCSKAYHEKNYLESMSALDRYDPDTQEWVQMTDLVNARHCAAVVALDNCVYMIGGMSSQEWAPLKRVELYLADMDEIYLTAELPVAMTGVGGLALPPLELTFRSESLTDMVRQKIGPPVHTLRNKRMHYRIIPPKDIRLNA